MKLFGQKKDPKEKMNEMISVLRKQKYPLQRDIQKHMQQQKQIEIAIKRCAKQSDMASAKIYAKEYVNTKKSVARLYTAISHIDCIMMELRHQNSINKMTVGVKKSTEVMKSMSALVKLPELQGTMQSLSKEMMKAGIIEEMVNDTMESTLDNPENMDELASSEVDRILYEITAGELGKAPPPGTESISMTVKPKGSIAQPSNAAAVEDEYDGDLDDIGTRLEALRN